MANPATIRKRKQRERLRALGRRVIELEVTDVEAELVRQAFDLSGRPDRTEYILDLIRADRDRSLKDKPDCPDCKNRGCFTCCSSVAEIRAREEANQ